MSVILLASVLAVLADVLSPIDPTFQDYTAVLGPPGSEHLLGTDHLGRDVFARLLHGARTSLAVGLLSQFIVIVIGVSVGALAGWLGGVADNVLMRFVDVVYAFPDLLLIMLLRSIFGGSIFMIFLAIGLVEWTTVARMTRAQVLSLKSSEYAEAARALGGSGHYVLLRHIVPNGIGPVAAFAVLAIPRAIFAEAALSYVGVGVQPPTPSWGTMVHDGYQAIFDGPHLVAAPAIAIALLTLAFALLADAARDALDPRPAGSVSSG